MQLTETMNMCRICLSSSTEKDIKQLKSHVDGTSKNYLDIFYFCLSIKIEDLDANSKLCLVCFKKVLSFYKFKCLALKNDTYLKTVVFPDSEDKNKVFLKDDIKLEELNGNEYLGVLSGTNVKEEVFVDALVDYQSDDEFLSVIKQMKYENIVEEEIKENVTIPNKRKRGRVKKPKVESNVVQVCEECGKTVKNMREHRMLHQPMAERRRFECKQCNKKFASYSSRHKHIKIKHLGLKKKCPTCSKVVVNLKSHELIAHKRSLLPFACVLCDRRFLCQSVLDGHLSSHTKDRPYQCDLCEKTYRTKIVMLQHRRQVHDKEKAHLCQFCSKSFFKKYHLQLHIRSHTKEKPYECSDCGRCFGSSTILKNHRMTHSDVKLFQCSLCDMNFARQGYLRAHMISHTKEKRHSCKYCGVKFGRSDHRNRHQLTVHERHRADTGGVAGLGTTADSGDKSGKS